jgi:hypothetical protein
MPWNTATAIRGACPAAARYPTYAATPTTFEAAGTHTHRGAADAALKLAEVLGRTFQAKVKIIAEWHASPLLRLPCFFLSLHQPLMPASVNICCSCRCRHCWRWCTATAVAAAVATATAAGAAAVTTAAAAAGGTGIASAISGTASKMHPMARWQQPRPPLPPTGRFHLSTPKCPVWRAAAVATRQH